MIRRSIFALVLGATLAIGAAPASIAPAQAAGWLEKNFWLSGPRYDAVVPLCQDAEALTKIASRFAEKEGRFWQTNLQLLDFERVREIAFRPWAQDSIPRRFCSAVALVSDGKKRPVYYSIVEDAGMIGMTWGVEWCVVGLDRNGAYNPACKVARP
jgi:hypothetical protein